MRLRSGSSGTFRTFFVVTACLCTAMVVAACCPLFFWHRRSGGGGTGGTELVVRNNTNAAVPVLLTLGAGYGISQIGQLPASWNITVYPDGTNRKGQFTLAAGGSVSFDSGSESFSANVAFGPTFSDQGCGGGPCYPNATNLAEFTLNQTGETVDISCVNGANAFIEFQFSGGAAWNDGPNEVTSVANQAIGQNSNLPGVYGWQATNCTSSVNPPNPVAGCPAPVDAPDSAELSSTAICNIQRPGDAETGGTVTILFNGWTPNSEPPPGCELAP